MIIFKDGKLGPIDAGDCELIEVMRDNVFKPVGMRIIQDRMRCQPGQVSMGSVDMKVEILEQPQPAEAGRRRKKTRTRTRRTRKRTSRLSTGRPPVRLAIETGGDVTSMRCAVSRPPQTQPVSRPSTFSSAT